MELPDASTYLEDDCAVDASIGEEGDDRPCWPTQSAPAIPASHPARETVAEDRVVPVRSTALGHPTSMRPNAEDIQEFA